MRRLLNTIKYTWWGGGWQPSADTILYLPLNSTYQATDQSWKQRTTTNYNVTFGTYQWVDCWEFTTNTRISVTPFSIDFSKYTMAVWCYCTAAQWDGKILDMRNNINWIFVYWSGNWYAYTWIVNSGWQDTNFNPWWQYQNQRVLVYSTLDNWNMNFYLKGNGLDLSANMSVQLNSTVTPNYITVWQEFNNGAARHYVWWLSELILESKVRTAQEREDYFNQTKDKYLTANTLSSFTSNIIIPDTPNNWSWSVLSI